MKIILKIKWKSNSFSWLKTTRNIHLCQLKTMRVSKFLQKTRICIISWCFPLEEPSLQLGINMLVYSHHQRLILISEDSDMLVQLLYQHFYSLWWSRRCFQVAHRRRYLIYLLSIVTHCWIRSSIRNSLMIKRRNIENKNYATEKRYHTRGYERE